MFDVNMLLTSFGLIGILGIIFMETGLLIGFIFPGDTLLFTAGIMAHANPPFTPLWTLRGAWRSTWILHRTHRRPPDDGQSCHALDRS